MNDSATAGSVAGKEAPRQIVRRKRGPDITSRDMRAIRWLGEQYGARLDVLGVLLGRLGGGNGKPLSHWTVRTHVERWERNGLVRKTQGLGQKWITPTRQGLAQVELDFPTWAVPVTRLRHCHAVNMVRLAYEATPQAEVVPWTSERLTYAERGKYAEGGRESTWHIPDGVLRHPDPDFDKQIESYAIEVELTHKSRRTYDEEVFGNLRAGTKKVLFYVPDVAFSRRLASDVEEVKKHRATMPVVEINLLPEVPGATYSGAW